MDKVHIAVKMTLIYLQSVEQIFLFVNDMFQQVKTAIYRKNI